jgi:hypothetical protein
MDGSAGIHLMRGTDGDFDYLLIARRGGIGLGLKVLGLRPGDFYNMEGKVYLHFRLRSSAAPDQAKDEEQVVQLSEQKLGLDTAWPNVKFEKTNEVRASTVFGVFINGQINSEEGEQTLKEVLEGGHIEKVVDFLIDVAGPETMVLQPKTMSDWIREKLQPGIAQIAGYLEQHKKVAATHKAFKDKMSTAEASAVGFHAAQMKSIYDSLHGDKQEDQENENEDPS